MKHVISRRNVLKGAAALGFGTSAPLFAFAGDKSREDAGARSVVLIYLRGAADFLNILVPRKDPTYELSRPTIAIGEDSLVPLDRDWGLHPALKDLKPIFDEELFAPITCVGSPHETRSHFDAQDFMNFAAPGSRTVRDGWLNRYLTAPSNSNANDFRAIGMQRLLPTCLRGEFPVLAVPDEFDSKHASSVLDQFEKFYGAGKKPKKKPAKDPSGDTKGKSGKQMGAEREPELDVLQSGKVTIETLRRFREIVSRGKGEEYGYPNTDLGAGMANIAQVLLSGEGLEAAAITVGGWDHHARQGAATGAQANLLSNLGRSIAAFRKHLGSAFENTSVMVMTEFGRTVRENGSEGTDHGHGSGMLLFGGGLRGGKVHGDWDGLRMSNLYQGRDLPVTTDFRDVFATVLREHMDFKTPKGFFPGYQPKTLKLFR
jgi:uncharacterized protein (DUF1501 family)